MINETHSSGTPLTTADFNGKTIAIHDHAGQRWLTAMDIGRALDYSDPRKLHDLYIRHADEFTDAMTCVTVLVTHEASTGRMVPREMRLFTPRGAHLLAMWSNTDTAKQFRKWVLDVLDAQTVARSATQRHDRALVAVIERMHAENTALMSKLVDSLSQHVATLKEAQLKVAFVKVPWHAEEEQRLIDLWESGQSVSQIAQKMARPYHSVRGKLERLRQLGKLTRIGSFASDNYLAHLGKTTKPARTEEARHE